MKTMMKKAAMGMQTKSKKEYPLKGIETPTPGSVNGKRGVPLSKNIQDGIKSGKLNKDGTTKNPFPKKKMGGSLKDVPAGNAGLPKLPTPVRNKMGFKKNGGAMKKAMMGSSMMADPMMKKGGSMKKCKYGCK
jgi:hypothetical protein